MTALVENDGTGKSTGWLFEVSRKRQPIFRHDVDVCSEQIGET